jgi:hypothetical protein
MSKPRDFGALQPTRFGQLAQPVQKRSPEPSTLANGSGLLGLSFRPTGRKHVPIRFLN